MSFNETLAKYLTPKDTEEVKPGLFIQKHWTGYRMIAPAAWNGKVNWKNFLLGPNWVRHLIFFVILMFLVWSYQHDNAECFALTEKIKENPTAFCQALNPEFKDSFTSPITGLNLSAFKQNGTIQE